MQTVDIHPMSSIEVMYYPSSDLELYILSEESYEISCSTTYDFIRRDAVRRPSTCVVMIEFGFLCVLGLQYNPMFSDIDCAF